MNYASISHISAPDENLNYTYSTALINDHELEVMFDSGAKYSVIPYNKLLGLNIPFNREPEECTLANGSIFLTKGRAKLKVILHESISEINFVVLPRENVLLGIYWFNANNAYIISKENKLIFQKRTITLENNGDDEDMEINIADL